MSFQHDNILMNHFPNHIAVHLKILMNKEIAHTSNLTPVGIRMLYLKIISQHTRGFTNDFYILHDAIVSEHIALQFFFWKSSCMSLQPHNSLQYVLQT